MQRARIEGWPCPNFIFGGKRTNSNLLLLEGSYTRIFNTAVRIPVPWHSRGYPILPDSRNCLFLVHMNNAALNFVLSVPANFRESFCAHLQRYLIWPFSLQLRWQFVCSIADDNLMSLHCPCRWSWLKLNVMKWDLEICSKKLKLSKFAESIHDMCTPPMLIWSFGLCPYNHEKIN